MPSRARSPSDGCTPCDTSETPEEAGFQSSLVVCQPGLQTGGCYGDYPSRSAVIEAQDICEKIKTMACFTLDDLNGHLKWGTDAYAGSVLIPPGVHIEGYGSWGCHDKPPWTNTASGGPNGKKWDFWHYDWRIDAFQLSLMEGYNCKQGTVAKDTPSKPEMKFVNYTGEWVVVAGATPGIVQTASRNWQEESSMSTSHAFTQGLSMGMEYTEGEEGVDSMALSMQVSTEVMKQTDNTLSQMTASTNTFECPSVDCSNGNLYQFQVSAQVIDEKEGWTVATVKNCQFVCMPAPWSNPHTGTVPRCPPMACQDKTGCQCCNGNYLLSGTPLCMASEGCNSNEMCRPDKECTHAGSDPYGSHQAYKTGTHVDCCHGTTETLRDWDQTGVYQYRCTECTTEGSDPYATNTHVDCCPGLTETKGTRQWDPSGGEHYRCDICPNPEGCCKDRFGTVYSQQNPCSIKETCITSGFCDGEWFLAEP